ncbi:ATP synthase subunit I [Photobacterium sp. SP02]|uniref:ATP synthase subunit I n=1 Tax=Photobacterium TaxID=657 RepID=UPI001372DD50|nr:ATP synthase subunit I [Photobacterium halotolerans]NAX46749.1 ATP synthase subunit I [Photobacterium halotolerans]
MMNNLWLVAPLIMGIVLGIIFFGGLWLTVQKTIASDYVALWFFSSLLVRTGIVLTGFYWICGDNWQHWLAALVGFSLARWAIIRLTRSAEAIQEGNNAP